eukprot:g26127.t1
MNFPVPWRCLLPHEVPVDPRFLSEARAVFRGKAVDFVTYNNHEILTDLSNKTGAMIDVSGDRDTPKRLSDRIITISGQANQKEGACLGIVEKLRKLQDLLDSEVGFFVIIVPATAIPVIVGIKGATIAEVLAGTGVEVSIGKENVMGMPDTPIGLEGTASQVTTAVANIHKVIQDDAIFHGAIFCLELECKAQSGIFSRTWQTVEGSFLQISSIVQTRQQPNWLPEQVHICRRCTCRQQIMTSSMAWTPRRTLEQRP